MLEARYAGCYDAATCVATYSLLLPCCILLLPHLRHVETPIVSDGKQAGIQQTRNNMVFTHATGLYITVVIALLHVAVIHHRITRYKSAMKHRLLHMQ